jgi:hypothetical protein
MVRAIVLFFILFTCIQINVQSQDTLNCEKAFKYYEDLFSDKVIFIWDTAPSIKKCSNKNIESLHKEISQLGLETVIVSMIIDTTGTPKCFRINQSIKTETKRVIIDKLKQLKFNPALQKKKPVESIYTLKL